MPAYANTRTVKKSFDETLARLPAVLQEEGFGILTEVDVTGTLKKKLNVDFRRYRILGACSPTHAHRALTAEIEVGCMLPCSIAVYETGEGETTISAINPAATMAAVGGPQLQEIAKEVTQKLTRALEKV